MDKLTPTARLTLDALGAGPGNVHELCERTGRSRSATDKALAELAKTGLTAKVDDGPADGAPTRWLLADQAEPEESEATTQSGTPDQPATDTSTEVPELSGAAGPDSQPTPQETTPSDTEPGPGDEAGPEAVVGSVLVAASGVDTGAEDASSAGDPTDAGSQPDGDTQPANAQAQPEAEEPKLCRGCQAQMPKICPECWQKTPTYCGNCRKTMPQVRRGEPGEPIILSNGLPKLRPGELEALVQKVMQDNSLPHHIGVTGWTPGRVAIFLPGRSPGAIANALRKLTNTGTAELIDDRPERFQLKATDGADTNADKQHETATPAPATADPATAELTAAVPVDQQAGESA